MRSVSRLRRIRSAVESLAEGNLELEPLGDDGNDELGQLSRAFDAMTRRVRDLVQKVEATGREEAKRLDRILVARTLELEWKNEDLAFILDNAGQGFVTVDRNGRLAAERSAILETWFGAAPEAVRVWDYVTAEDPTVAEWFAVGWEALFDGVLPPEVCLDQLPKEVRRGQATFGLRYQPILHEGQLDSVILVVSDISGEIARRKAETTQRELAGVFARLVTDFSSVEQFITEGTVLVDSIRHQPSQRAVSVEQQRWIHTLKGNASFLGLESLSQTCHEMETQIAETGEAPSGKLRARLFELWEEFTRVVEPLMFGRRDRAIVPTAMVKRHIEAIRSGAPRNQLASDVETWLLEPAAARLERAAAQSVNVARRLEKPEPNVIIEDNGLRLDAQKWAPFWNAFVHVVRNATDHGIEPPEVRVAAGKPEVGTLILRAFPAFGETVIEVEDDGGGIDFKAVRERAGLPPTAPEALCIEHIFRDGVSTKSEVSETSGRGVGLSAARAACRAMGGRIEVKSRAGVGTVFSFHVPSATTEENRPSRRPPPRSSVILTA